MLLKEKQDKVVNNIIIYIDKKIKEVNKEISRLGNSRVNSDVYKGSIATLRDLKQFIKNEVEK